jgi:hypothetical protein
MKHTHEGSAGNLQHEKVIAMMDLIIKGFDFKKANDALEELLH